MTYKRGHVQDRMEHSGPPGNHAGERTVAEASGIGLWSWRPESDEFLFTREWLEVFGLPPDATVRGEEWLNLIHPVDRQQVKSEIFSALGTGELCDLEFRVVSANGESHWVLCKCRASGQGQETAMRGIVLDLTARKAEEQSREREIREKHEAQIRQLASELAQTAQRERDRMAQVLHDHLQQLLVAAKFQVRSLVKYRMLNASVGTRFELLEDLLVQAIHACRSLTVELSPFVLQQGLAPALKWLGGWMREKHGLAVSVIICGDCQPSDKDLQLLLFQSAQELLLNVVKHANVDDAELTVERLLPTGELRLTVRDRGAGFDPGMMRSGKAAEQPSFGLFSIKQRLELVGGRMRIHSRPGLGARIDLIVPPG